MFSNKYLCPLCNNAKSNLIDEESWRKLFVPAMKEYYRRLLEQKIQQVRGDQ